MSPFLECSIGNQKIRTEVHHGGALSPVWNDTLSFKINSEDKLCLSMIDCENVSGISHDFRSNLLGCCGIPLQEVFCELYVMGTYQIFDQQNSVSGDVRLIIEFVPDLCMYPGPPKGINTKKYQELTAKQGINWDYGHGHAEADTSEGGHGHSARAHGRSNEVKVHAKNLGHGNRQPTDHSGHNQQGPMGHSGHVQSSPENRHGLKPGHQLIYQDDEPTEGTVGGGTGVVEVIRLAAH